MVPFSTILNFMMTSEIEQNCATILWKRTRQLVLRIEKCDFSYIFNTKYEETQYCFERLNSAMFSSFIFIFLKISDAQ